MGDGLLRTHNGTLKNLQKLPMNLRFDHLTRVEEALQGNRPRINESLSKRESDLGIGTVTAATAAAVVILLKGCVPLAIAQRPQLLQAPPSAMPGCTYDEISAGELIASDPIPLDREKPYSTEVRFFDLDGDNLWDCQIPVMVGLSIEMPMETDNGEKGTVISYWENFQGGPHIMHYIVNNGVVVYHTEQIDRNGDGLYEEEKGYRPTPTENGGLILDYWTRPAHQDRGTTKLKQSRDKSSKSSRSDHFEWLWFIYGDRFFKSV